MQTIKPFSTVLIGLYHIKYHKNRKYNIYCIGKPFDFALSFSFKDKEMLLEMEVMHMRGYRGGNSGGGIITLLVIIILAIYAMPLVGGYVLVTGKDEGSKVLGGSLLIVGIIIWIVMGVR